MIEKLKRAAEFCSHCKKEKVPFMVKSCVKNKLCYNCQMNKVVRVGAQYVRN